ncbi:MAG TPA: twin-arginine translocation signal domain-containing protein, partial [Gammaproteobacteria bacterium]|nr:twin-arginine translocation signal domain-containing protein [Gammaproteobacteria bacterium]
MMRTREERMTKRQTMISRRRFIKGVGAGAGALLLPQTGIARRMTGGGGG